MENKKMSGTIKLLIAVGIIVLAGIIGSVLYVNSAPYKAGKQLELGNKYLSEMNYEQALASYQAALDIEPRNVDAYLGMAEVYIAQGNKEEALQILETGYEMTESEEIQNRIEEIKAQIEAERKAEEERKAAEEAAKEAEQAETEFWEKQVMVVTEQGTYKGIIIDNTERYEEQFYKYRTEEQAGSIIGYGIIFPDGMPDKNGNLVYEAGISFYFGDTSILEKEDLTITGLLYDFILDSAIEVEQVGELYRYAGMEEEYTYHPNGSYMLEDVAEFTE